MLCKYLSTFQSKIKILQKYFMEHNKSFGAWTCRSILTDISCFRALVCEFASLAREWVEYSSNEKIFMKGRQMIGLRSWVKHAYLLGQTSTLLTVVHSHAYVIQLLELSNLIHMWEHRHFWQWSIHMLMLSNWQSYWTSFTCENHRFIYWNSKHKK